MKRIATAVLCACMLTVLLFSSCTKATRNWIKGGWTMQAPIKGMVHMDFIDDHTVIVSAASGMYTQTMSYQRSSTTLQLTEPQTGYQFQADFSIVDGSTFRMSNFLPIADLGTAVYLEFKRD
jgi:hypothetical protein